MKEFLQKWDGWLTLAGSVLTGIITLIVLVPKITAKMKLFYERLSTIAEIGEIIKKMETDNTKANLSLENGIANLIAIRRIQMDMDPRMMHFEMDKHGHMIWANRLWHSVTGLQRDEARGSGWEIAVERKSRPHFLREYKKMLDHQRTFEDNVTWICRDGVETSMKLAIIPVRNKTGDILNYHGIGEVK